MATVRMPSSLQARKMRMAISPRLAHSTLRRGAMGMAASYRSLREQAGQEPRPRAAGCAEKGGAAQLGGVGGVLGGRRGDPGGERALGGPARARPRGIGVDRAQRVSDDRGVERAPGRRQRDRERSGGGAFAVPLQRVLERAEQDAEIARVAFVGAAEAQERANQ